MPGVIHLTDYYKGSFTGLGLVGLRPHGVHSSLAMKLARASADRPIRALFGIIHFDRRKWPPGGTILSDWGEEEEI